MSERLAGVQRILGFRLLSVKAHHTAAHAHIANAARDAKAGPSWLSLAPCCQFHNGRAFSIFDYHHVNSIVIHCMSSTASMHAHVGLFQ